MLRPRSVAYLLLVFVFFLPEAISSPPNSASSPPQNSTPLSEVSAYLEETSHAIVVTNLALKKLGDAARTEQTKEPPFRFATLGLTEKWLDKVVPYGAESGALFRETRRALQVWIASVKAGDGTPPPMADIRLAMSEWRGHTNKLGSLLAEATRLELQQRAELWSPKPFFSASDRKRFDAIAATLSNAEAEFQTTISIPVPIPDSERSRSPFEGKPNFGRPDRLYIWTGKSSTLLGESVPTEVGLANRNGPNVKADHDYSVRFDCDGCIINNSDITIHQGDTVVQRSIRVTAPRADIRVSSGNLHSAQANVKGCFSAKALHLVPFAARATGLADGVSQLRFGFVFQNNAGQPATNGAVKQVIPLVHGVGTIVASSTAGSFVNQRAIQIPFDECASEQAVISDLVGRSKVTLQFPQPQPAPQLEFTFGYCWPLMDILAMIVGGLLGFLDNVLIPGHRFLRSLLESTLGAIIAVSLGYMVYLDKQPMHYTWLVAGSLALIGGTVGVRIAKAALGWLKPN